MTIQTIMNIAMIIILIVLSTIISDTLYRDKATDKACIDNGGIHEHTNGINYCIFGDYAADVLIVCEGLFNNIECVAIEVLNN